MIRTNNAATASRDPIQGEAAIQEFANSRLSPAQLRKLAAPLLRSKELLRDVQKLTPEDQMNFVNKVDQVCRYALFPSPWNLPSVVSGKVYPTVGPQTAKYISALGNVCSITVQLPTSAILSTGLKKRGEDAVASGGLADMWRGKYRSREVAIKAFRVYKQSDRVKKVRTQPVREALF